MSTPWATSVTPVGPPTAANPTVRQLLYAGVVTGAWSAIGCLLVYVIGGACGVDWMVTTDSATTTIPWIAVILVPLAAGVVGALASSLLRGRRHCGRLVYVIGTAITVLSLAGPVIRADGIPTKILLGLMHVISWFLIVPQIARIVGDSEPGRSVERGE